MRKLWLRLYLWWNNICPEHGPMFEGSGPSGHMFHYCIMCNRTNRKRRALVREIRRKEYKAAVQRETA